MLIQRFGKRLSASAVGDEIQLLGPRRIGGRLDRGAARIGDRPGRQTFNNVSVVGRRLLDLATHDRTPKRTLASDETVNDRWIRLQLHALPQPVDENGG